MLAVFKLTPTLFTQRETTSSNSFFNKVWSTSCWYWPTPIDFGSILTNSAKGSCKRLPIETAPRTVTSLSGNSSRAIFDAE